MVSRSQLSQWLNTDFAVSWILFFTSICWSIYSIYLTIIDYTNNKSQYLKTNAAVSFWWSAFCFLLSIGNLADAGIVSNQVKRKENGSLSIFKRMFRILLGGLITLCSITTGFSYVLFTNEYPGGAWAFACGLMGIFFILCGEIATRRFQTQMKMHEVRYTEYKDALSLLTESGSADSHSDSNPFEDQKDFQRSCCCGFWKFLGYLFMIGILGLQMAATYQSIGIAVDVHSYHTPGRLIPVTDYKYKLHIHCLGEQVNNSRTVIIDSGLTFVSTSWNLVLPEVAKFTRVCVYDRAGYAWSEAGVKPRTSKQIADELKELLENAGEEGPFILVGHSFAGYNLRLFATFYRDLVSGMVLLDASHEDQDKENWKALNLTVKEGQKQNNDTNLTAWILKFFGAPLGIWRFTIDTYDGFISHELSREDKRIEVASKTQNEWSDAIWSELSNMGTQSADQVRDCYINNSKAIVTAGQNINGTCKAASLSDDSEECETFKKEIPYIGPVWYKLQQDQTTLANNSTWIILWESGHNIPLQFPNEVIKVIHDISEKAKNYVP